MKRLIKKAVHDWNNRDVAIVYIDGTIYEDAIHGICLQRYFQENDMNDKKVYLGTRPEVEQFTEVSKLNGGQDVILAHRVDKADSIYFIYGLRNGNEMSDSEIKADLKEVYPDYEIINDLEHDNSDNHGYDEDEQIEKGRKRIDKFSFQEVEALFKEYGYKKMGDTVYYNDYAQWFYDVWTQCCSANGVVAGVLEGRDFSFDEMKEALDAAKTELEPVSKQLTDLGFELDEDFLDEENQFAFIKNLDNGTVTIWSNGEFVLLLDLDEETEEKLEENGFENRSSVELDQIPKILELCDEVYTEASFKIKRLNKEATHDWNNRDFAIVYIGGTVYEDATHAICLKKYLEENQIENDFGAQYRPDIEVFNEVSKLNDGQDVILAHRVDNTNEIYFIYGLKNGNDMSESEIKADLSEIYPDYEIINDLEHDDSDNHGYDEDEQTMKGYQRVTDYSLGEVGESMKNKGFKLNYQYNIFYNEYCHFEFDIEEDRCFVYGVVNEIYDKYTRFKFGEMERIADEVLPSCKEAYDVIQSCGLAFEENELVEYTIFAYSKQVGNGKVTLRAAGSNEFEFEFEGFSDAETSDFAELGVEEFERFGIDELPEKMEIIEGFGQQANLKGRLKRGN